MGIYHKIKLDYRRGLGKIYTDEDIRKAKESPSFEREYNLKYYGLIGNTFPPSLVERCMELGDENSGINTLAYHPCGVDFGFSDAKTVICVGEWDNEKKMLRVVKMDDFGTNPPTPEQVANRMFDLYQELGPNTHFFVDGSNAGTVNQIKIKFQENLNWRQQKQDIINKSDRIHPINFGYQKEHCKLLFNMYDLASKDMLAIPSKYEKLITSMRTAMMVEYDLDKNETVNHDYLDACRLMCKGVAIRK